MSDEIEVLATGYDDDITERLMAFLDWAMTGLEALEELYGAEELDRDPLVSDIELRAAYDSLSAAVDAFSLFFNITLLPVL